MAESKPRLNRKLNMIQCTG